MEDHPGITQWGQCPQKRPYKREAGGGAQASRQDGGRDCRRKMSPAGFDAAVGNVRGFQNPAKSS